MLSRLVPQLHIFLAAMPGHIVGGMVLLALIASGMLAVVQQYLQTQFLALPGL